MKKRSFVPQEKKGWIKIVEAFTAILLITGVLLVVLQKGQIGKDDNSERIYDAELSVLKNIQSNESLRQKVLDAPAPVNSSGVGFPPEVNNKMNYDLPNYLECEKMICELDKECVFFRDDEKDVYARSLTISSTLTEYKPRQLKIFCWVV